MDKMWAHSGDSHFLESADLYQSILPAELAERMPRAVKDADGSFETVHIDGESFRRPLPRPEQQEFYDASMRAPGAGDVQLRLQDLDAEGIWGELVFPSLGMWNASIKDPGLLREGIRAANDWALSEIQDASPRFVVAAQLPLRIVDDAVVELQRLAAAGAKAVFLPTTPPTKDDYNRDSWDPLWDAAADTGIVLAFHIGTDPVDLLSGELVGVTFRGPGGAVLNHTETTFSGQRAVMKLPELEGARLRGRSELGAVPRGSDERVLPAARLDGPPEALPVAQGDPLRPGLCLVPARRERRVGADRQRVPQPDVGQ
jgi:hypothetical protein